MPKQEKNQISLNQIQQQRSYNKKIMQSPQVKLHDWQILQNVAPYLKVSDLLKTATLSKEFNYTLRNYLRKHILPKNFLSNNVNQLSMMKKIFHRHVKCYNVDSGNEITHKTNAIWKSVQTGTIFTLVENFQGQYFIIKQYDYPLNNHKLVEIPKEYSLSKILLLIGDFLYYTEENILTRIPLLNKHFDQPSYGQKQQIKLPNNISHIKYSNTHLFIAVVDVFHQSTLLAVSFKQFAQQKLSQVIYYQKDTENKHFSIDRLYVGSNCAYYLSHQDQLLQLNIQDKTDPNLNNSKILPKAIKTFKGKRIRKIINGNKHFFVFQKTKKITEEWDNSDLIAWAQKEGYEDYVKIFKAEKVTGKILLKMEKRYIEDVLGILGSKIQQRLQLQLEENNIQREEDNIIYAWGRNDKSQLGLNPSNNVSNPQKIQLPHGFKFLRCFNNYTFLHNAKTGEIAINSISNGKAEWKTILKSIHSIWSVSMNRDTLMVLCSVEKDRIPQQLSQVPVHHKKEKLRTAKNIIDKIEWDQNLDKNEFRVGYFDKYTGILQISFQQLLQSSEIKDYRIEYFKRNGQLVWSKKDRIDIL